MGLQWLGNSLGVDLLIRPADTKSFADFQKVSILRWWVTVKHRLQSIEAPHYLNKAFFALWVISNILLNGGRRRSSLGELQEVIGLDVRGE